MTNLTIRKVNKDELQTLIDYEMQAYAVRVSGFDIDHSATPDAKGNFPRKYFLGAIEQIVERSLIGAMGVLQQRLDDGYRLFLHNTLAPEVTAVGAGILYVTKPDAIQAEDATQIATQICAKYEASIDAHNDKVFAQEAAALKAEELAVAAQLKREDEQKAAQEFDKRVRERMRGAK